ncbi:hypothetical protein M9435_006798 [Picochlorum sp. BPE23]|uniref:Transcription initiation factor TFIID subunit 9 n=1 Tax=Picochlorum oklahomense TaxID=249345 RepID=A0A7S1CWJ3_9CHLO|nr:hypothetical protein M9435_006798 [Picochlorum sp. BPE23]
MPSKEEDTFKGGPLPGDVQVICDVLDSAKVEDYDCRVVDQLVSFMYGYTSNVLQDAQEISKEMHAETNTIGTDDVAIAMKLQSHHTFVDAPPLHTVGMIASQVNSVPLPEVVERDGLRIPVDESDLLTNPNVQLEPKK